LTLSRLRSLLSYDPETGHFTRLVTRAKNAVAGDIAGTPHNCGYVMICVDRRPYLAHRLAVFYVTGAWPREVDHIDMNKSNNRWINLRVATRSQNRANTRARADNTHGCKGVTRQKKRWRPQIMVDGKRIQLGLFIRKEDAAKAYLLAAQKYFGEFARGADHGIAAV
jgi:hypothetical protein